MSTLKGPSVILILTVAQMIDLNHKGLGFSGGSKGGMKVGG